MPFSCNESVLKLPAMEAESVCVVERLDRTFDNVDTLNHHKTDLLSDCEKCDRFCNADIPSTKIEENCQVLNEQESTICKDFNTVESSVNKCKNEISKGAEKNIDNQNTFKTSEECVANVVSQTELNLASLTITEATNSNSDTSSPCDNQSSNYLMLESNDLDGLHCYENSMINVSYPLCNVSYPSEDESSSSSLETESENEYQDHISSNNEERHLSDMLKRKQFKKAVNNCHADASQPTVKYYEIQLEFLESTNRKLVSELSEIKNKLAAQEVELGKQQAQIKAECESKLEKALKQCEILKKEKEDMVIRYANSEKEVIIAKKIQNDLEKKLKDLNKERDNLCSKVKGLSNERNRLCNNFDQKVAELVSLQREYEKTKEELNAKDIKIKWVQNKLKTEIEAHKETQGKLEHNMHRLQETREEAEQIRKDCQEMIRRYQEAEEIKSVKLDHQLKQKLSELEVQKQERSDQEEVYQLLRQELEALKKKQRITIEENNSLTLKIHSLEKERLEYEQTLSKLKDNQNSLKQEVVDLTARLAEMENLSLQLEREKEKYSASVREVERLRQTNAELQADMDACHMKEGELLEFTEKLTAKTVHLQSEHSLLEGKTQALEEELARMNKQHSEMEQKIANLSAALDDEQKQRQEETQILARKLAEKTKIVEQLNTSLEEADNENRVMKRRHITSIKELSRELQQCRKRLEVYESCHSAPCETTSLGSRASSSASLDTVTNHNSNQNATTTSALTAAQVSPPVTFSGGKVNSSQSLPSVSMIPNEVDKQMLIERIVRLQKLLARKNDKIEFLEDHTAQLVKEMKKKSRIIQNYIIREETGALVPNSSDQNKMELTKRGGIMASVYSSQLSDNNMTLELSLEINHKLQAVLEDTLLKNITLKENINTLGEEIARLTTEQRELSKQLKNKCLK